MSLKTRPFLWLLLLLGGFQTGTAHAELLINEILFNPPGTDIPNEYIELRGTPNLVIPAGTYFVVVEGDTNGIPGTVQNTFDLSGRVVGGNGFLVLLQKTNSYVVVPGATALVNTDTGTGFGSGSTSSIKHKGENNQTELENGSATFFLIQAPSLPPIGSTIDTDTNGVPDGVMFAGWTILDSVGVIDGDSAGDIAYGAINFRRGTGIVVAGNIVTVNFSPSYLGRAGNTTGSTAADWIAGDNLGGGAPNWTLGSAVNTVPAGFAGRALNHLGGPNFGAPALPGVRLTQSGNSTDVSEAGVTDTYTIGLNTKPSGSVVIRVQADPQLEISSDGISFRNSLDLAFTTTTPQTVTVRAIDDNVVELSPHPALVSHAVHDTSDAVGYPLATLIPSVTANITDNDSVLLSELKVNPPGADEPNEFIELKGAPDALLSGIYFLAVEGNAGNNPGTANLVINLSGARLGSSGLLLITATNGPYFVPDGTTVITDSRLNTPGGALGNGTISFLLLASPSPINEGSDLDNGNNGTLEGLPNRATILDAVGWSDGNTNDIVYGGVILGTSANPPDAATRFAYDNTPRSAAAWYYGGLTGDGATLIYDEANVSPNFPTGTPLTPGVFNNSGPSLRPTPVPLSGVVGDPNNPRVRFLLTDADTDPDQLLLTLTSTNPAVVPNDHLLLTPGPGGERLLTIDPVSVGYTAIILTVSDDDLMVTYTIPYAASAMGRPGGIYHLGASDGSTAIPIDANLMLIGDDENEVIRLYDREHSGLPLAQFDFTSFLGLIDFAGDVPREVDIEASTRVGDRIFWLGSQSHSAFGAVRTNRSRVFATDISGQGTNLVLTYAGRYDHLKADLINWDVNNQHGKGANYYGLAASSTEGVDPKSVGGYNIEGLAMAPGSMTTAYICFRAPIVPATNRTYALVLPVLNFTTLVVSGAPGGSAVFGPPIELDLFGRGVRSIEGNASGGYLIIAGASESKPGPYPRDFALYTWTGNPADPPQLHGANLSGLNPEGIVELPPGPWTAAMQFQLVSDNGAMDWYGDGIEAKHLTEPNFKKCRSDWITLGPIVPAAPHIISTSRDDPVTTITWRGTPGFKYRVQFKSQLAQLNWTDLPGDVTATGPLIVKTDNAATATTRYYRVMLLP